MVIGCYEFSQSLSYLKKSPALLYINQLQLPPQTLNNQLSYGTTTIRKQQQQLNFNNMANISVISLITLICFVFVNSAKRNNYPVIKLANNYNNNYNSDNVLCPYNYTISDDANRIPRKVRDLKCVYTGYSKQKDKNYSCVQLQYKIKVNYIKDSSTSKGDYITVNAACISVNIKGKRASNVIPKIDN